MKQSHKMNLACNANDAHAAVESAWNTGLLRNACMQRIATQCEMSQSDFCPECQAAVTSQLMQGMEGRLIEALIRIGLPPDSVQIVND